MFLSWIKRYLAYKHVELCGTKSGFYSSAQCQFHLQPKSSIKVTGGALHLGFPLPGTSAPYASFGNTVLSMGEGSKLICEGDVFIAPGATIRIAAGAEVVFRGDNLIAHNFLLLCTRQIVLSQGASASWNVTLIDDDGHRFCNADGAEIPRTLRPLIVGKNAGIQMNVMVPRAVNIGDNAIIGAGTVVRQDVPDNCLAYAATKLTLKEGVRTMYSFGKFKNE